MRDHRRLSDRNLGFAFFIFLLLLAFVGWIWFGQVSELILSAAIFFLVIAFIAPGILLPLNCVWTWFGSKIGPIINGLVLGIFYFGVVFPTGLVMKILRVDPLQLKHREKTDSYWTEVGRSATPNTYKDMF